MKELPLLPKGHECIFKYPLHMKVVLDGVGISYERKEDHLLVKGFVAGDSYEEGLSVVALDNPEWCICRALRGTRAGGNSAQIIERVASGFDDGPMTECSESHDSNVVCPY